MIIYIIRAIALVLMGAIVPAIWGVDMFNVPLWRLVIGWSLLFALNDLADWLKKKSQREVAE